MESGRIMRVSWKLEDFLLATELNNFLNNISITNVEVTNTVDLMDMISIGRTWFLRIQIYNAMELERA